MDTYAVILNGMVVNTVIASPGDYLDPKYVWIIITGMEPYPGIGWAYDGANFIQPIISQ